MPCILQGGQMHLQDQRMAKLELQSISNAGECQIRFFDFKPFSNVLYDYIQFIDIFDYIRSLLVVYL